MRYRKLGRSGFEVSEIGYGMWGLAAWSGVEESESRAALERAVELGCNFFDTAWAYGDGKSERILGELVRAHPGRRLYVATKIPPKNREWPSRREHTLDDTYPPDHIEEYVHSSIENLGLESFDLIQLHTWEDRWLDDDRWIRALERLRDQGLFRAIGISLNRWEQWNGIEAVKSGLIDCVQVIYNIFDQNPKDALFPACREHDVGVIARVPFDEGTLTGTLTRETRFPAEDWRSTYFVPENLIASVERAERVASILPSGMTLPEAALRFILAEPTVSTTIPGMRRVRHVELNLATSDKGPLEPSLLAELERHRWDRKPTSWSQ